MHWVAELAWAIELIIMYDRWCNEREFEEAFRTDPYAKAMWVRMCMRIGDHGAHHAVALRKMGKVAVWKWDV
jgi:hypothetical protein